jgi:nitroreductase
VGSTRRIVSMTLVDTILNRRSIRHYKDTDIPKNILNKILEAGRQAPSAANRQPIHFVILTDPKIKKELSKGIFSRFIKETPITIVGCAKTNDILTGKWAVIDTTIALQNMVIAAWSMGVGSCWIGAFREKKVRQMLNIPKNWKIVALVTFGYTDEQPEQRKKKSIDKLVSFNDFN